MRLDTSYEEPAQFHFESQLFSESIEISGSAEYQRLLDIPPGQQTIDVRTTSRKIVAPWDTRDLWFRIVNTRVVDERPRIQPGWKGSFSAEKGSSQNNLWRWCGRRGFWSLRMRVPRRVRIRWDGNLKPRTRRAPH
jgi:hypothetical protein